MTNSVNKILLKLDYMQGPIWVSDTETGQPLTGYDEIDNNQELASLNLKCRNSYCECYEYDKKRNRLSFNQDKLNLRKDEITKLITSIKSIISEIGENKYYIDDEITSTLELGTRSK